jgi:phosphate uptake regulator
MKRKLIKQGIGGYTIYLPKRWVDSHGLTERDSVDVDENPDSLTIKAKNKTRKEYALKMHEDNIHDIRTLLTHLYRNGADLIEIEELNEKAVREIQHLTAKLLLGFEITQNSDGKIVMESISEPSDEKFDAIIRRIFLIIKEGHKLIVEDFERGSFKHTNALKELVDQQDKLVIYCRRSLLKMQQQHNPILMWELLTFLMHIMHAYSYMYKAMHDAKVTHHDEIAQLLNGLELYYDLFYQAYFKKDIELIHKMNTL